jgi:hypothetical protein
MISVASSKLSFPNAVKGRKKRLLIVFLPSFEEPKADSSSHNDQNHKKAIHELLEFFHRVSLCLFFLSEVAVIEIRKIH